jgi:subtilase family serine protease
MSSVGNYAIVPAGALNPNTQISVVISLTPTSNMQAYLNTINNPESPNYNHFLTTQQIATMFGQPNNVYNTIISYFESYGLTVTPSAMHLTLTIQGTATQVSSAFHTKLQAFDLQYTSNGMWNPLFGNESAVKGSVTSLPFYANTEYAYLPSTIQQYVSGVSGLVGMMAFPQVVAPQGIYPGYNFTNVQNLSAIAPSPYTTYINSANGAPFVTIDPSQPQYGNYTWAQYYGTKYQFLFPGTMHILTGASNLWSGATTIGFEPDLGQGVTVAVIEVGGIDPSIIGAYSQAVFGNANQVLNRFTQIGIGFTNPYKMIGTGFMYGWDFETALDIEYVAAMAPLAHIDVIAIPDPMFTSFFNAYAFIADYLTGGNTAPLPSNTFVMNGNNYASGQIASAQARSITITSNSYGTGEEYAALFGSPMYLTVENELLTALNIKGVTNFFASGDYASAMFMDATGAGMPAIATGSTSVGGGQLTAMGPNGQEFPVTSTIYNWTAWSLWGWSYGFQMYVVPAKGIGSFTYWAYGFGMSGTFMGIIGGGFGQSFSLQQPWWQNAIDVYSTGARTDPIISGSAAFNMTVFFPGYYRSDWVPFYGGTSFATPIAAGEWALIEEQANVAFGTPAMGDINPILFAAHNAYEAGVSSLYQNPYVPMTNIGTGFDWAPVNSFDWYFFNLSINQPSAPVIPYWFPTLNNPAGSGWNFLQGLGLPLADIVDKEVVGQTPSTQHALMNEPFMVMVVTPDGLQPITTLVNGTTYTLQVVEANGQPGGFYTVTAFSGQASESNGSYSGGVTTTFQTSSNGQFTYTPVYTSPDFPTNATEYGYFLIKSLGSSEWSFQAFAVAQPKLTSGNLVIGVTDAEGIFQTNIAEVTMFTTGMTGYYNLFPTATVMLNGQEVANAVVTETAVSVTYYIEDPTLNPAYYASGVAIGTFLTDTRGMVNFWDNAFIAENNGPIVTQVITLQASYDGLTSNVVTVYVEPQAGDFHANVALNTAGTAITGTVGFFDMKYVNWVNVSIGPHPGQFVNISYPSVYYDSNGGIYESGVYYGIIPVDFWNITPGTQYTLSMEAQGVNDLSISYSFLGFTYIMKSVGNPIIWYDPSVISVPPVASLSTSAGAVVNGIVTLQFSDASSSTSTGTLTVSSVAGTETLATNLPSSGTYEWNTTTLQDGYYLVTYTVTTSAGTNSQSLPFYVDNNYVKLTAEISTLNSEITNANAQIASLQSMLNSANQIIASLNSQVSTDTNTINTLNSELSNANATISSLEAQVSSLQSQLVNIWSKYNTTAILLQETTSKLASAQANNSADQAQIATLQAQVAGLQTQLSNYNTTISTYKSQINTLNTQISGLKTQVSTLQGELSAKSNNVAPSWYTGMGSAGIIALIVIVAIVSGIAGVVITRKKK